MGRPFDACRKRCQLRGRRARYWLASMWVWRTTSSIGLVTSAGCTWDRPTIRFVRQVAGATGRGLAVTTVVKCPCYTARVGCTKGTASVGVRTAPVSLLHDIATGASYLYFLSTSSRTGNQLNLVDATPTPTPTNKHRNRGGMV